MFRAHQPLVLELDEDLACELVGQGVQHGLHALALPQAEGAQGEGALVPEGCIWHALQVQPGRGWQLLGPLQAHTKLQGCKPVVMVQGNLLDTKLH